MSVRVAFAGVAHSHPFTDAANLTALGAEVAGVWDADDADRLSAFAERFRAPVIADLDALLSLRPDVVVATPRTARAADVATACAAAGVPVFLNKTIATSAAGLRRFEELRGAARWASSSVLRFAPEAVAFADRMRAERPLCIQVAAQHDIGGFLTPERRWQDEQDGAGGTLLNIGIHAFELLDLVTGGDGVEIVGGTVERGALDTRSESAGLVWARTSGGVPVTVSVSGVPGPDEYSVRIVAESGVHTLALGDASDLGYAALAAAVVRFAAGGDAPVGRERTLAVYRTALLAAAVARGALPETVGARA